MPTKNLFIGTSGWYYKDWLGPFYPKKLPAGEYLSYYASHFSTVEIDSTFYRIPTRKIVTGWYQKTPDNFLFSPKFPQIITHEKRLTHCRSELDGFLNNISLLGEKLGPLILQFDYRFTPDYLPQLSDFLPQLPPDKLFAIEIRNRAWFKQKNFFDLLEKHKCALVLQDLYYMPKFFRITAPFSYIRLLGNRKQIPDDFSHVRVDREEALNDWAGRILAMLNEGLTIYAYSNNRYQGHAPTTVKTLLSKIQS